VGTGSGIDLLALFSINPKIEVVGVDISRFKEKYSHKFIGMLPEDVKIIRGKNGYASRDVEVIR